MIPFLIYALGTLAGLMLYEFLRKAWGRHKWNQEQKQYRHALKCAQNLGMELSVMEFKRRLKEKIGMN